MKKCEKCGSEDWWKADVGFEVCQNCHNNFNELKKELTPEQLKELHEGYDEMILKEYNDALNKLSEALENLNQTFKDGLADAKSAYAEIWHIVNKNNKLF